jgi:hypothetical protein
VGPHLEDAQSESLVDVEARELGILCAAEHGRSETVVGLHTIEEVVRQGRLVAFLFAGGAAVYSPLRFVICRSA